MVVCISGVVQNPNTYSVSGLTLTFSQAPPTGTNNIGVLYLGIPATSVSTPGNTAYLSSTQFTATAGQTTFTPSGTYQVGFVNVIRNGSQLAPSDYTATNGTTVVLANACVAGDVVVVEVYNLVSVSNALPLTGGTVTGATTFNSSVTINGGSASGYTGFKNRIINGGMVIDQRNSGASVTPTGGQYTLDRWTFDLSQTSKLTCQQNAGSVTPPTGFTYYLGITSSSAYSITSSDYFTVKQFIEGYNIADLAWGTASAATVTLSFWVRSSLTGTFGGTLQNSANNRSYPFTYTISSANTWEQKSITIAGDTSGTWLTTNGIGVELNIGLGVGSTYSGTAGSWSGSNFLSATGATSVVGVSGATFYVTGVQLERGSNATSFEFRDYGREFQMCQRYYETAGFGIAGAWENASVVQLGWSFSTPKRATPTLALLKTNPTVTQVGIADRTGSGSALTVSAGASYSGARLIINGFSGATAQNGAICIDASSIASANAEL